MSAGRKWKARFRSIDFLVDAVHNRVPHETRVRASVTERMNELRQGWKEMSHENASKRKMFSAINDPLQVVKYQHRGRSWQQSDPWKNRTFISTASWQRQDLFNEVINNSVVLYIQYFYNQSGYCSRPSCPYLSLRVVKLSGGWFISK